MRSELQLNADVTSISAVAPFAERHAACRLSGRSIVLIKISAWREMPERAGSQYKTRHAIDVHAFGHGLIQGGHMPLPGWLADVQRNHDSYHCQHLIVCNLYRTCHTHLASKGLALQISALK